MKTLLTSLVFLCLSGCGVKDTSQEIGKYKVGPPGSILVEDIGGYHWYKIKFQDKLYLFHDNGNATLMVRCD